MLTKTTLAVCVSLALLAASAFGGVAGHLISLTELSSTNLTATYDGSAFGITVTPGANPDTWTVVLPSSAFILGWTGAAWTEPEISTTLGNTVSPIGNNTLLVTSDVAATPLLKNGATIFTTTFDTRDAVGILISFNDLGDGATTVPETGSTLGLLALTLTAMAGASRLRCFRIA